MRILSGEDHLLWTRSDGLQGTQEKVHAVVHAPKPENRSTGPFIVRTDDLLPQVLAKPGHCPTPNEPTFGTKQ